jgi:transaldolase
MNTGLHHVSVWGERLKIFLDSADVDEIKQVYEWGIVDGVTTNPSLLKLAVENSKTKVDLEIYIRTILKTAKGTPVSIEVTEMEAEKMFEQGKKLFKFFNHTAKNVVIKIPVNTALDENGSQFEGLRVIRMLSKEKIPVNATLIFTPEQALLAAKAGAKYVSPFAGRIDDYIRDQNKIKHGKNDYFPAEGSKELEVKDDNGIISGVDLVAKCVEILKVHKFANVEVIAASLRNTRQVREAALAGAHIATIPFPVIKELLMHPKTFEGMKKFSADAAAVPEFANLK